MADPRLAFLDGASLDDASDRQEDLQQLSESWQYVYDSVDHGNDDNASLPSSLVPEPGSNTFPEPLERVEELAMEAELTQKKQQIEVLLSASELMSKTVERAHQAQRQLYATYKGLAAELDQVVLDKERVEKWMNEKEREWEDDRKALQDENTTLTRLISEKERKWEDDRLALQDKNAGLTRLISEKEQKWEDDRLALQDENTRLKRQLLDMKNSSSRAARPKRRGDFDPGSVDVELSAGGFTNTDSERKSERLVLPGGSARRSTQVDEERSQLRSDFDPDPDDVEPSAVGLTGGDTDSGVATGAKSLGMEIGPSNGVEDITRKISDHFEIKKLESKIRELERKCSDWERKCRDLEDSRLRDRQACN